MIIVGLEKKIEKQLLLIWRKFSAAFPVICFFLCLFFGVVNIFGSQYVMIVSLVTVLFQVNHKKRNTLKSLLGVSALQLMLCFLAYIATLNFPLSMLLNLTVPFALIFLKASQFNQMGYFSGLMTFTFLQLMPVDFSGFLVQMAAMLSGLSIFIILVLLFQVRFPKIPGYQTQQKGLLLIGRWLKNQVEKANTLIGDPERKEAGEKLEEQLHSLEQKLYIEANQKREKKEIATREGKICYMFALMFQQALYFIKTKNGKLELDSEMLKKYVWRTGDFLETAGNSRFWEKETREILLISGRKLLSQIKGKEGELYISLQNLIRPLLIIFREFEDREEELQQWSPPESQKLSEKLKNVFRLDSFETRFALRMSVVLLVSFAYTMLSQADHGYWLPMNAFLLLRPMYEDRKYRMKTRFIGTAAGCVAISLLLPFFHGTSGHFFLAAVMVVGMYTATPGTRIHGAFVTCFALSMSTLAMKETLAIELRMLYVAAAVLLVLVVNKFFFPTSMGQQFRYNFQMIFHMQHMYLRILERSLTGRLDHGVICDAQIQYHMLHEQVLEYLGKISLEESGYYRQVLDITWKMMAEMEQILFLVNIDRRGVLQEGIMENYISYTDYVLNQIQQLLHIRQEKHVKKIKEMHYQRWVDNDSELSYLMTRYAKNLSSLYRMVSRHRAGRKVH